VMDILDAMWKEQRNFTKNFIDPATASEDEKISYVKEMILYMQEEAIELLQAAGAWKKHRKESSSSIKSGILEELIDMFKYLLNIAIVFDISPYEFVDCFIWKSQVVKMRWEMENTRIPESAPVVGIDLDGVLTVYPKNWISFVNKVTGMNFTIYDYPWKMRKVLGDKYKKLKHRFRDEGYESLWVDPTPEAPEFTQKLKRLGYYIIIISSRPYRKYKRILRDTLRWLINYKIHFDKIIWREKKHEEIAEKFPNLSFFIEDDPMIAYNISRFGYKVFLIDKPYNRDYPFQDNVVRVKDLLEILDHLRGEK